MSRQARQAPGGYVYHVLNRGVNRRRLFAKPADYAAFERVMARSLELKPTRLLAYCLMPNHWHLVLWPRKNGELAAFMQHLTVTHVTRWQEHFHCVGQGHVYQGRFKSFPVECDRHFLSVCRYVEGNALRAGLVERAESWAWCSLGRRVAAGVNPGNPGNPGAPGASVESHAAGEGPGQGVSGMAEIPAEERPTLSRWPLDPPVDWVRRVNHPESAAELEALRLSVSRGRPYGGDAWLARTTAALGLDHTLRTRGRPPKTDPKGK